MLSPRSTPLSIMVNKEVVTLTNNEFVERLTPPEMRVAMDDLRLHNQTLKYNVIHIQ